MQKSGRVMLRGFGLAASALALAACAHTADMTAVMTSEVLCETDAVTISTEFDGAGHHGCAISTDGPVLTVWPEASIAGPINPSPWYAFEADIHSSEPVKLRLDYAGYWHRYFPWISRDNGQSWQKLGEDAVTVGDEGHIATVTLPGGPDSILVAGRPLITPADMSAWSARLAERYGLQRITYGKSLDGRSLEALTIGPDSASRIVIALTGQHPPEQSGVAAFEVFAETLMAEVPAETRADTRFVFFPLVNPDGRARGNWRHNNGGLDLNRDWMNKSQPAIKAITRYISQEAEGRDVVAFLDFHSTQKTLVYTPPFEEAYADMSFPQALKNAFDTGIDPAPEWIDGHNAEAGTSKNWALQTLDVAGLTVELGDDAPPAEIESIGRLSAHTVINFLSRTAGE
ncbi:MAG: hypothetical protein GYB49_14585 [Alphaproteobacteria bacterium]|nr:hypothetical protein [Alphaproteobacteria bacterium]|tara:strand:- start:7640 stop:8842 length:1203 start_codon:yes stop_codon:yes gene_type:complete